MIGTWWLTLVLRGLDQHTCDPVTFFWVLMDRSPTQQRVARLQGAGYKAPSRPADLKTKVGVGTVMITCTPYRWRRVRSGEALLSESPPICSVLRIDTDLLERRCWRDRALLDLTFAARSSDAASRSVAKICGPDCSTCWMMGGKNSSMESVQSAAKGISALLRQPKGR